MQRFAPPSLLLQMIVTGSCLRCPFRVKLCEKSRLKTQLSILWSREEPLSRGARPFSLELLLCGAAGWVWVDPTIADEPSHAR